MYIENKKFVSVGRLGECTRWRAGGAVGAYDSPSAISSQMGVPQVTRKNPVIFMGDFICIHALHTIIVSKVVQTWAGGICR